MKLELKIKDVVGMTEEKRHIFLVDNEELKRGIMMHPEFILQEIIKQEFIDKHHTKLLSSLIDNAEFRNTIYMQEKARRDAKLKKQVNK